jgi:hypothetical protein
MDGLESYGNTVLFQLFRTWGFRRTPPCYTSWKKKTPLDMMEPWEKLYRLKESVLSVYI